MMAHPAATTTSGQEADTMARPPMVTENGRRSTHVSAAVAHLVRTVARAMGQPIGATADELVGRALESLGYLKG